MDEITRPTHSLGADYFAKVYAEEDDPWGFETRAYEAEKYARTMASLPRERYRRCFEVGCSVGVLSELLLGRCDELVATEINDRALARARERNAGYAHGHFLEMNFPKDVPEGTFDLVVLSEVAYYWAEQSFMLSQKLITERLLDVGGDLMLVHYTPEETDYPMTGDEVHERWLASNLRHLRSYRGAQYRLDVMRRG